MTVRRKQITEDKDKNKTKQSRPTCFTVCKDNSVQKTESKPISVNNTDVVHLET